MPDAQGPSTLRSSSTASAQPRRMPRARHALAALAAVATMGVAGNAQAVQPLVTAAEAAISVNTSTSVLLGAAKALEANRDIGKKDAQAGDDAGNPVGALQDYIADKYRVSTGTVRSAIEAAWSVAGAKQMDPLLLLAVMAVESSFNPRAESGRGAQGLMQVMTRVHRDKFEPFGGVKTAWHPEVNINVGAQILQDCISRRGSVPAGLTCYVGSAGKSSSYGRKVLAERDRLRAVLPGEGEILMASAPGESEVSTLSLAAREGDISHEPIEISASLTQRDLSTTEM